MKNLSVGQKVEIYITQYEDRFEETGETCIHLETGVIRKATKTYVIIEDEQKRLHFISLAKHQIKQI